MSKAGKMIKGMLKAKKESVMGKLANGDDPMEPWSKRFDAPIKEDEQLDESDPLLFKYIRSLGWEPKHMDFATRSKYARSNAFKNFKVGHTSDPKDRMEESENLDEAGTGLLMSYIKAKGLDPRLMDGNQKASYSRSSEFQKFKSRHVKETSGMGERGDDWNEEKKPKAKKVQEAVDEKDTVTMDIPLLIRVLEYAREDAKTDMDLHKVVENLINMRRQGALSMDMYNKIVAIKEEIEKLDELKKQSDTQELDSVIAREDLRKWFSKTDPEGGWKRINSKGEAIGPCAREPGEPKPKCMSNEKRAQLSKKERAAAVAAKRKHDPVADRPSKGGKPVNVSNFGKGKLGEDVVDEACWDTHKKVGMKMKGGKMVPDCRPKNEEIEKLDELSVNKMLKYSDAAEKDRKKLNAKWDAGTASRKEQEKAIGREEGENRATNKIKKKTGKYPWQLNREETEQAGREVLNCVPKNEDVEQMNEKNSPTNSKLWARAKSMARSKFDVYPSAYANGWASKWYKSKGGGWKSVKEDGVQEGSTGWHPSSTVKNPNFNDELSIRRISPPGKRLKSGKLSADERGSQERTKALMKYTQKRGGLTGPKGALPEETELQEGIYGIEDSPLSATNSVKAMESAGRRKKEMSKSARMIKAIYKKKNVKETLYDWEKSEKGAKPTDEPTAKVIMKGGTTMTGKPRDTVEIGPVLRTKLNSPAGNKPSV